MKVQPKAAMKANKKYEDNKRFLSQSLYLKRRFGRRVFKVPLNIGCICPNRDGTKGLGGCTFCSSDLSGDFIVEKNEDIEVQYYKTIEKMRPKWGENAGFIPYFQSGSNTYGKEEFITFQLLKAMNFENSVGLAVATRADCISDSMADFFEEISKKTYLTVELGLQTIFDSTAEQINRCMSFSEFSEGFQKLKSRGVNVCVHIINGLPGEDKQMMLKTAEVVSSLKPHSVKIHMLDILKGTEMARKYEKEKFHVLTLEEYVDIVCCQLELLDENIIIERLTGDGKKEDTIEPKWSFNKRKVLNAIDCEMIRRNAFSGDKNSDAVLF